MVVGTDTKKMVVEQKMVEAAAINNKVEEGERKGGGGGSISSITTSARSKSASISTATVTATTIPFPITKYISGQVFDHLICSRFLVPADMISLLQVNGITNSFSQLSQRYCKIHGVKLDLTYEDYAEHNSHSHRDRGQDQDQDNDDSTGADNDIRFLLWCLEQQAFISAAIVTTSTDDTDIAVDGKPPSFSPDCLDCRMARFHNQKRCPCCNDFEIFDDIFTCGNLACETKTACDDCHEGRYVCNKKGCHDDNSYCLSCFDGCFCESCDGGYHTKCMPSSTCHECLFTSCLECTGYSGNGDIYKCEVCDRSFCTDCRLGDRCSKCEVMACRLCKESFYCDSCEEFFCCGCDEFGGIGCSLCEKTSCSECDFTYMCKNCDSFYCSRCREEGIFCSMCKGMSCSECEQDYNTCMFCNLDFCADCKGGSYFASSCRQGCCWACVDCLQRANSTSRSKTNEEGDSCANCFISEDDMDNVNLKQCSSCKTVKYCSRSCQKDDWKEHRHICNAVVVAAAAASDDNDVEEETKGEN